MMSCVTVDGARARAAAAAAAARARAAPRREAARPRAAAIGQGETRARASMRGAPPSGEAIADAVDPRGAFRAVARQTRERGDAGAERGPALAPARTLADAIDTNAIATVVSRARVNRRARVCMLRGGTDPEARPR